MLPSLTYPPGLIGTIAALFDQTITKSHGVDRSHAEPRASANRVAQINGNEAVHRKLVFKRKLSPPSQPDCPLQSDGTL